MNKVGMKKIWIYLVMSLGLAACSNEVDSPFAEGMGGLRLTAKMDTEITIPVITKSADFSGLRVEDLFIRIYDEGGRFRTTGGMQLSFWSRMRRARAVCRSCCLWVLIQ